MRKISLAIIASLVAACSGSSSSTDTTPTPAAGTASASSGAVNPCSTGSCMLRVTVDPQVAPEYQRRQVNYKLFQGCPRNVGVASGTVTGYRGMAPVVASVQTAFAVPATFQGRYGTVVRFEGPAPQQYAVVDFGAASDAPVNFGQLWNGNALTNDQVVLNTNSSFERRVCR
jgi:hypothetical protein